MFKRLILWIMLIALPLQSYAAAAMMHCAPRHEAAAQVSVHHHDDNDGMAMHKHADDGASKASGAHSAANSKCSACSTCCLVGMAATNSIAVAPTLDGTPVLVPHPELALPSVVLEGQKRPPRPSIA
ncbi:MAG: hypothetical protein KGL40_02255 [Rhodocyclaceae bacterium]|nr:hypothetical protein [Rhodocyclaceae bacterium]